MPHMHGKGTSSNYESIDRLEKSGKSNGPRSEERWRFFLIECHTVAVGIERNSTASATTLTNYIYKYVVQHNLSSNAGALMRHRSRPKRSRLRQRHIFSSSAPSYKPLSRTKPFSLLNRLNVCGWRICRQAQPKDRQRTGDTTTFVRVLVNVSLQQDTVRWPHFDFECGGTKRKCEKAKGRQEKPGARTSAQRTVNCERDVCY